MNLYPITVLEKCVDFSGKEQYFYFRFASYSWKRYCLKIKWDNSIKPLITHVIFDYNKLEHL